MLPRYPEPLWDHYCWESLFHILRERVYGFTIYFPPHARGGSTDNHNAFRNHDRLYSAISKVFMTYLLCLKFTPTGIPVGWKGTYGLFP